VAAAAADAAAARSENDRLRRKAEANKCNARVAKAELDRLNSEVANLQKTNKILQQERDSHAAQLQHQHQHEAALKECEEMKKERDELRSMLDNELEQMKTAKNLLSSTVDSQKKRIAADIRLLQELDEQLKMMKERREIIHLPLVDALTSDNEAINSELSRLKNENATKAAADAANTEETGKNLNDALQKLEILSKENVKMKGELKDAMDFKQAMEIHLKSTAKEVDRLSDSFDQLKKWQEEEDGDFIGRGEGKPAPRQSNLVPVIKNESTKHQRRTVAKPRKSTVASTTVASHTRDDENKMAVKTGYALYDGL
ncbi:hypothetical protein PFISCL1PPCAC_6688, partial [Pristionchus fissidentatus]